MPSPLSYLYQAVWDSSIVVSKMLEQRAASCVRGCRCLDLSAGCGLVAAVLLHLGARAVVATDLAGNLPLLRENCESNGKVAAGCRATRAGDRQW
jgi:predicted nicotinamide N-methyase